jgi:hypothetical protein
MLTECQFRSLSKLNVIILTGLKKLKFRFLRGTNFRQFTSLKFTMRTVPCSVWGVPIAFAEAETASWLSIKESERCSILRNKYLGARPEYEERKAAELREVILNYQLQANPLCKKVKLRHLQDLITAVNGMFGNEETTARIHLALRSIAMALAFLVHFEQKCREVLRVLVFLNDRWVHPITGKPIKKEKTVGRPASVGSPGQSSVVTSEMTENIADFWLPPCACYDLYGNGWFDSDDLGM